MYSSGELNRMTARSVGDDGVIVAPGDLRRLLAPETKCFERDDKTYFRRCGGGDRGEVSV